MYLVLNLQTKSTIIFTSDNVNQFYENYRKFKQSSNN